MTVAPWGRDASMTARPALIVENAIARGRTRANKIAGCRMRRPHRARIGRLGRGRNQVRS